MDSKTFIFCLTVIFMINSVVAQECYSCSNTEVAGSQRKKRDLSKEAQDLLDLASTQLIKVLKQLEDQGVDTSVLMPQIEAIMDNTMTLIDSDSTVAESTAVLTMMKGLLDHGMTNAGNLNDAVKKKLGTLIDKIASGATSVQKYSDNLVTVGVLSANVAKVGEVCGDPFNKTAEIASCSKETGQSCGKIKVTIGDVTSITRSCIPTYVCDTPNYSCCDDDKCNTAFGTGGFISYTALILAVVSKFAV